jgi:16S rRNA (guanine(966)-N(2))-methyltransferase RsmD
MTRIVAGQYGGRRLVTPRGLGTRPTSDQVREALFATLGELSDQAFLDLYAGSGAVGLEAASRGADRVVMVENSAAVARVTRRNIEALAIPHVTLIVAPVLSVLAAGPGTDIRYDVVFADPPYAMAESELAAILGALVRHAWLAPAATVVIERSRRSPPPAWGGPNLSGERSRQYGETALWYGHAL